MLAPNQGRAAIKLHGFNPQKCPHPHSEKPPRPRTTKPPRNLPSPLPGSPRNQLEKVHGKSEKRYSSADAGRIFPNASRAHPLSQRCQPRRSDWQWFRRISVQPTPGPFQAHRTILESFRAETPLGSGSVVTQQGLRRPLELNESTPYRTGSVSCPHSGMRPVLGALNNLY